MCMPIQYEAVKTLCYLADILDHNYMYVSILLQ